MSLYVGINNTPKAITSLLIGNNNTVKEASSAYTGGVNSKNLVYNSFNLSRVNPVRELTSGKITTADIGKTVYLSNSQTECQEWRIANITINGNGWSTVDLVSKYILCTRVFDERYNRYKYSSLRTWLNGDFLNGFDISVANALSTIYNGDKVSIPTGENVGLPWYENTISGKPYPLFGDKMTVVYSENSSSYANPLAIYYYINHQDLPAYYWIDETPVGDTSCFTVTSYGGLDSCRAYDSNGVVAVIHFLTK